MTREKKLHGLALIAVEMRTAQKAYADSRSMGDLSKKVKIEKEFDAVAKAVLIDGIEIPDFSVEVG